MANILLKQIPPALHAAIKERARQNHRSMNGEILDILERELLPSATPSDHPPHPAPAAPRATPSRPAPPPPSRPVAETDDDLPAHLL